MTTPLQIECPGCGRDDKYVDTWVEGDDLVVDCADCGMFKEPAPPNLKD